MSWLKGTIEIDTAADICTVEMFDDELRYKINEDKIITFILMRLKGMSTAQAADRIKMLQMFLPDSLYKTIAEKCKIVMICNFKFKEAKEKPFDFKASKQRDTSENKERGKKGILAYFK